MLLPPGVEKHKNLSTSFTRFDQLLQDLSENRFSGYIKLSFWAYESVLVLDTGRMIEAMSHEKNVHLTGEMAILRIFAKALEPDGTIEVYDLSSEIALALGYALQSSTYRDESAFGNYSLAQVFDYLEKEAITGYVDLQFTGQKGDGTVYYLEGTPVEAVVMSKTGKMASGDAVFRRFLEIGELVQPMVKVYRVYTPRAIVEEEAFLIPWQHANYQAFWKDVLGFLQKFTADQLRSGRFYAMLKKVCSEVSDHYPFLHPETGDIRIAENHFEVKRILHHPTFLQGISIVLNKVFAQFPARKFKKVEIRPLIEEIRQLAEQHDIAENQLDPQRLIQQIFRGVV